MAPRVLSTRRLTQEQIESIRNQYANRDEVPVTQADLAYDQGR